MEDYDLIVIGSGPAGEKAAVKAAYFLKKVAIIEKSSLFGGTSTYYTVPSKALRELAVRSKKQKMMHKQLLEEFLILKNELRQHYSDLVLENLQNHSIDIYKGVASFVDANHIRIVGDNVNKTISGKYILIAGGVKTSLPKNIPIDGERIHTVETLANISKIPASICISGAGVIGCEYATMFANFGTKVHLTDERPGILGRVDKEIVGFLEHHMNNEGIELQLGKKISLIKPLKNKVKIAYDGQEIKTDMMLVVGRRIGQLDELHLQNSGVSAPDNKLIPVNDHFQTNVPNIYAVGDIIGPPSLVNTGMDQGRYAVSRMFELHDMDSFSLSDMPQGIYTIPEISSVGLTEEAIQKENIDYVVGKAYHADIARGLIRKAEYGMLKLVVDKKTQKILGVHIIGDQATELIHYGVDLVVNHKNLNDIVNSNFNFPCLHELYKYAAYNGLEAITGRHMKKHHVSQVYEY